MIIYFMLHTRRNFGFAIWLNNILFTEKFERYFHNHLLQCAEHDNSNILFRQLCTKNNLSKLSISTDHIKIYINSLYIL